MWPALAGGVVALGIVWGAYEMGHSAGRNSCEAAVAREERIGQAAGAQAAQAAASAIAGIKVTHTTVRSKLETEIREKPVFVDCRSGPGPVELFNRAIPGAAPASEPAGPGVMPAADAAR